MTIQHGHNTALIWLPQEGGGGGTPITESWVGLYGPPPKTLTLFKVNSPIFPTLSKTRLLNQYPAVQADVKAGLKQGI